MLVVGNHGPQVQEVVIKLRRLGFVLDVGEIFSTQVKRCVEAFQVANVDASGHPLEVDGKVGPNTQWALEVALGLRKANAH